MDLPTFQKVYSLGSDDEVIAALKEVIDTPGADGDEILKWASDRPHLQEMFVNVHGS